MPEKRVLYIDDAETNLMLIRFLAEDLNFHLDTAMNGEDGLEKINEQGYDLLLTDIRLPDISGFEILEAVRNGNSANRHIPVIAFSADVTVENHKKIVECGFTERLNKPFNPDDFDQLIQVFLHTKLEHPDLEYYRSIANTPARWSEVVGLIVNSFIEFDFEIGVAWHAQNDAKLSNIIHKIKATCINLKLNQMLNNFEALLDLSSPGILRKFVYLSLRAQSLFIGRLSKSW